MVKLRLTRLGKKHSPSYRLIAIQARTKRDGEALEYLGFYNPMTSPSTVEINKERVEYWLSVGAQPTKTVRYLLSKENIIEAPKKKYSNEAGQKSKDRTKAKAEKAAEAKKPAKVETEAKEEAPAEAKEEAKEEAKA